MTSRSDLNCTLLGDGPSDQVLKHPIGWLLRDLCHNVAVQIEWADLGSVPRRSRSLAERMSLALELYPAEILFVHRDAETKPRDTRVNEIQAAAAEVSDLDRPCVCVVPVRMTEAWFIFDAKAIREAAGNPNGLIPLSLPPFQRVEEEPDPKRLLKDLLTTAADLSPSRARRFRPNRAIHRLAQVIRDYGPLRKLTAFRAFEADLTNKLTDGGWIT